MLHGPEDCAVVSLNKKNECIVNLIIYEIDHCTALRPCSTRHMTPEVGYR